MDKARYLIIILFLLVILLISLDYAGYDNKQTTSNDTPTYKSDRSAMVIYSPKGNLKYCFVAKHIEYFSNYEALWFTRPVLTTYNNSNTQTWLIRSDCARLTNNNILHLYGHVEINALIVNTQLRKLSTKSAQINLINQDVISQDKVILYGTTFNSTALKMHGNLNSKCAKFYKKVITSYEVQDE